MILLKIFDAYFATAWGPHSSALELFALISGAAALEFRIVVGKPAGAGGSSLARDFVLASRLRLPARTARQRTGARTGQARANPAVTPAAEGVVGVMVTGGVVLALPLPGGLLLSPVLQPLRTSVDVKERARSFLIILDRPQNF